MAGLAFLLLLLPAAARAQGTDPDKFAINAAGTTRLAYVVTGNDESDGISKAGLFGLSLVIAQRTAAELGDPIGVNLETDELAFFPVLYWRVPADEGPLSAAAEQRLSDYLKHGGMVLFDTADQLGLGGGSADALRGLLRDMDVPTLVPAPPESGPNRPGRYAE